MKCFKGQILVFNGDPGSEMKPESYSYYPNGHLIVKDDRIVYAGDASIAPTFEFSETVDYGESLLMAGFVDTHIHYPQIGMIASYGEQLLEWLQKYAFPEEKKFENAAYASAMAKEFVRELFRNGTTTALVFSTVHPGSADALFTEAEKFGMCLITGKTLMDRNAPDYLCDTPESAYSDSKKLIESWHGKGRLRYAVTPRFAITSSDEQLSVAGKLLREFPDIYMQTHLSENRKEIETVGELFPENSGYLDVYDSHGLAGSKSIFAHCVHLTDDEFKVMKQRDAGIAFCPCSNLFLGSGLVDLDKIRKYDIKTGIGTDVGGGNSFSVLLNLNEAYKVAQLKNQHLNPLQAFYMATLGGAKALSIHHEAGTLKTGYYADFMVLNPRATPLMKLRMERTESLVDLLFILMMMGDSRCIEATYVGGKCVHQA
jgi:guanine deaminase